jgi:hypothetical protein
MNDAVNQQPNHKFAHLRQRLNYFTNYPTVDKPLFLLVSKGLENYLHNFETILDSKWIQNCVCQGPHVDALKSGISMVEKKDPTEIAYGFCSGKEKAPVME